MVHMFLSQWCQGLLRVVQLQMARVNGRSFLLLGAGSTRQRNAAAARWGDAWHQKCRLAPWAGLADRIELPGKMGAIIRGLVRSVPMISMIWFASMGEAQDLDGRDTASNWRVTHYETFGIWNSICDEREEQERLKQRCYVRWVDVYAEQPDFGALFMFLTPSTTQSPHHMLSFGPELGTVFLNNGFRVQDGETTLWSMTRWSCLYLARCDLEAEEARHALSAMLRGTDLVLEFYDPKGREFHLDWSLEGFPAAVADFETQWQLRK